MGLLEVLTVILVVLKITGLISISWFAVFIPLMIAVGIYIVLFIIWIILIAIGIKSAK